MTHVLHLVKDPGNRVALEVIRAQGADATVRLTVVLMHEAVRLREPLPGSVYRLHREDAPSGAAAPGSIDASALLDLIFDADTVVAW